MGEKMKKVSTKSIIFIKAGVAKPGQMRQLEGLVP